MNPIREKSLEQLVRKAETSRASIAKILVRDFPIEQDMADLIALSATNQAIGLDEIADYDKIQRQKKVKLFFTNIKNWFSDIDWGKVGRGIGLTVAVLIILACLTGMGSCVYSCATATATASSGGISFAGLLTIVFIVLKLTNVIDWSWFWVLSPLIFSIGLGVLITIIFLAIIIAAVVFGK